MANLSPALWRDIMGYLRQRHAPLCRQWFEELEPVQMESGLLQICTANAVQQNYLQRKCLDHFTEAAQAVTGALVAVRFVTQEEARNNRKSVAAGQQAVKVQSNGSGGGFIEAATPVAVASRERHGELDFDQNVISPDYSFENFITGPNNQLAYAAAVAVANQPGVAYNPLFIHGGVGLGKTHLLQAICQSILQNNPDKTIYYLSCDAFMNQFIECIKQGRMNEFRDRYRHADMLVIDDIHFLTNRDRSQEEFFHTFNALYQSNKQIVISSDAAPSEIPQLEERLVSRFQWGLVANVTKPSFETRVAIIQNKIKIRGLEMSDDVIHYLAGKIDSNTRELEGAINNLQHHSVLQNKNIDLPMAREAMGDTGDDGRPRKITLQNIIDAVTTFYNVKLSDLQSKRRHKSITQPRQVCMWLARRHTRYSLEEIGGYFGGRDHTTVMHSIKTVDDRASTDSSFSGEIQTLEEMVVSRS